MGLCQMAFAVSASPVSIRIEMTGNGFLLLILSSLFGASVLASAIFFFVNS